MKSALLVCAAALLFSSVGCHHHNLCQQCDSCSGVAANGMHGGHGASGHGASGHGASGPAHVGRLPQGYLQDAGPTGPPSASYGYPYYTTRAPRDFLQNNPMGIGP